MTNKKELSEALREAMDKEGLHTRDAARLLNINPCYISMALNDKSWDHLGISAWERIEDWMFTRGPLAEYKFPEGEAVFIPKAYVPKAKKETAPEEHSPAAIISAKKQKIKKQRSDPQRRALVLELNRKEIDEIKTDFSKLYAMVHEAEAKANTALLKNDESKQEVLKSVDLIDSRISGLSIAYNKLITAWEGIKEYFEKQRPSIIIFQRNIYQK
jgi:hypothetical protein